MKGMRLNEIIIRTHKFATFIHCTGLECFKGGKALFLLKNSIN